MKKCSCGGRLNSNGTCRNKACKIPVKVKASQADNQKYMLESAEKMAYAENDKRG